jgi:hypothetical protein
MWTHGPKKRYGNRRISKVQVYKAHRNQMDNQRRRVFYTAVPQEFCVVWPVRFKTVRQLRGVSKVVRIRKTRVRSVVINRLGVR